MASLALLTQYAFIAAGRKSIAWSIADGLFRLIQFSFDKVLNDVTAKEKVTGFMSSNFNTK